MDLNQSFGYWVRRRRKALDLTQKELAQQASCSLGMIKKIEADERRPSRQLASLLADCLAVSDNERDAFIAMARGSKAVEPALVSQTPLTISPGHNLPISANGFVGRSSELTSIQHALKSKHQRLINILGPGGIGKTRLAVEAAWSQTDLFADGVWFVSLVEVDETVYLPGAIAEALNLPLVGSKQTDEQLRSHLHDKEMLLVLDNFEQLLPDGVDLLTTFWESCPSLKVLTTSRERLNVGFETVLVLGQVPQDDGVDLFCQRARQVNPRLTITPEVRQAARRIWELISGMPLGLELAAAWARLLEPDEIVTELEQNLDLLRATQRDVPDRHRSMFVVFEASWQRLTPTEHEVLKKLSVFRGGFTRDAAEQVGHTSLATLLGLVDKSLVERPNSLFRLHEIVRQYAYQKLAAYPPEKEIVHARHAAYYIDLLKQVYQDLTRGKRPEIECLQEIEQNIGNMRAAWLWSCNNGAVHTLIPIAIIFWYYFDMRGLFWEISTLLQHALNSIAPRKENVKATDRILIRALLLGFLATAFSRLGKFADADRFFEDSIVLFNQIDAPEYDAEIRLHQAVYYIFKSQYPESIQLSEKCWAIFQACGQLHGEGASLNSLGVAQLFMGKPHQAKVSLTKALGYWETIDSVPCEARTKVHLGLVEIAIGEADQAIRVLMEAVDMLRKDLNILFLVMSLNHLGLAYFIQTRYEAARTAYLEVLQLSRRYQILPWLLMSLGGLGMVAARQGQTEQAVTLITFFRKHPLAPTPFMLGHPENVLAKLEVDMPRAAFISACDRGETSELSLILNLVGDGET